MDDASNRQDGGVIEVITKSQSTEEPTVTRISQHVQASEMVEVKLCSGG